jgi:SAM-dependent methyltransferase
MYAGDRGHNVSQYKEAIKRLAKFKEKSSLFKLKFEEALGLFEDEYFDFIYIDGYAHTGQDEGKTINDWYRKLKVGGFFAGHDYSSTWPKVIESVDSFALRNNLKINLTKKDKFPSWYVLKNKSCSFGFEYLRELKNWPLAVNNLLLCDPNSEEMKSKRATGIIDFLKSENIYDENKKVLDYGCGEGHLAKELNCTGYDIENHNWIDESSLTCDFEKVKANGPYDLIMLHDVVDHMKNIEDISNLKEVLNEDGKIFIRCHPWSGRHGGHLYQTENKAFIHLFLEEADDGLIKVKDPENFYQSLFEKLGYKVEKTFVHADPVESFFDNNHLIDKLKNVLEEGDIGKLKLKMTISFYDFILGV